MTAANVYATRSDLYRYGLPRGLLANPGRLCASVLAATDTFELDGHGFETGDALLIRAQDGGALPAPVIAAQTYYAIRESEQTFKVSATAGGGAIDLTTDGSSVLVASPLPFDEVLEFYSRFVDPFIPGFLPLTVPYPITIVATVAKLAADELLRIAGQSSRSVDEAELAAKAQLERWAKGDPLRDPNATGPVNLAYAEAAPAPARNWGDGENLP